MNIKSAKDFPLSLLQGREMNETLEYLSSLLSAHGMETMTISLSLEGYEAAITVDGDRTVTLEVE